ncbi:putative replicase/helicase/endonuclease [Rhizophagus clarus]|uniref:Putative replicase/helicase/endonuclease n=1 Tax=Rhizophagus clarus TaxID=94130 RepID=A0A8H3MG67_9GLOM|nr:putative replicase/helicase/endonuclease [Rhizophagus clarus]
MAPTGIVAENVGGETIHSKLKITEYIIIEKISMVSSQLFTFISKIFCKLHSNSLEFGGIPVLVIVRIGILSEQTIQAIKLKVEMYQEQNNTTLDTTYIVSHRKMAQTINSIISTKLPSFNSNEESFTSISVNFVNNEQ